MKTAKEVLENLNQTFKELDEAEAKKLWDVLSALRGPDEMVSSLKYATTSVIRGRVFPDNYAVRDFAIVYKHDDPALANIRGSIGNPDDDINTEYSIHFLRHAKKAFDALDLKWKENNN